MTCLTAHRALRPPGPGPPHPDVAAGPLVFLAATAGLGAAQVPGAVTPVTLTVPPQPPIDPAAPLFDGSVLHDLRLTMKPDDWDTLKARFMWDTYYPADFEWRGVKVPMVAVRSRGQGSRNPVKPSIRIDFNRYHEEQRFLNLNALVLANAAQDPAMLNRRLSMAVFSRVGLPAPRVVHARVFVNERVRRPLRDRRGGREAVPRAGVRARQPRQEARRGLPVRIQVGGRLPVDVPRARSREVRAAVRSSRRARWMRPRSLYGPIEDMIRTINEVSDADFETEVGKYLHIQLFIRHLAVERFISDIDGFLGDWGPNNFYLYRFEDGTLVGHHSVGQGLDLLRPARRHLQGLRSQRARPAHPGPARAAARLSREPAGVRRERGRARRSRLAGLLVRGGAAPPARPDPGGREGGREQALHQRARRRGAPGNAGIRAQPQRGRGGSWLSGSSNACTQEAR